MTVFRPGWDAIPAKLGAFYDEFQINTLTTLRPDGRPHVVPVGVALDSKQQCAWVITVDGSRKVENIRAAGGAGALVALCQVDGPRWSTIEGTARVLTDEVSVARAVERYASRYRQPDPRPGRVAIRIEVDRIVYGPMLAD